MVWRQRVLRKEWKGGLSAVVLRLCVSISEWATDDTTHNTTDRRWLLLAYTKTHTLALEPAGFVASVGRSFVRSLARCSMWQTSFTRDMSVGKNFHGAPLAGWIAFEQRRRSVGRSGSGTTFMH